jgi:SET domain-containing protein
LELQKKFTLAEKGWRVPVEWKPSDSGGIGVFAKESIPENTVLRIGIKSYNLMKVETIQDIERFCSLTDSSLYHQRLRYVADYLWGFYYSPRQNDKYRASDDERFFGFWIPGNGLNHNETPNTEYRATIAGINLVALENIEAGQELFDDYRRHGTAPRWLKEFATDKNLHLNFADCNDFVS